MTQIDITKSLKGVFGQTLKDAEPGDEIIYALGEFATGPHREEAYEASEAGDCFLYQRRVGNLFAYIARKVKKK